VESLESALDEFRHCDDLGDGVSHGPEGHLGGLLLVEHTKNILGVVHNGGRVVNSDLVVNLLLFDANLAVRFHLVLGIFKIINYE
jgi:hypothetical protein